MKISHQIIKLLACVSLYCSMTLAADNMPASFSPPAGLQPQEVPMFVTIGFDDNGRSGLAGSGATGAMTWITDFMRNKTNPIGSNNPNTFDGTHTRVSFFNTATYVSQQYSESPTLVKRSWRTAYDDGHEIGNHTHNHDHGSNFTLAQWKTEINSTFDWLTKPYDANESVIAPDASKGIGVPASEIYGFRTPFLEYNNETMQALYDLGYLYDCSIEDGWEGNQDGTNYRWPYTLDNGSPGHDYLFSIGSKGFNVGQYPGMWEMPVHPLVVPPDSMLAEYGLTRSVRTQVKSGIGWFDVNSGKMPNFDWNLFVQANVNKAEALAILKHTFKLRMEGNRAPLLIGAHTDYYSSSYTAATGTSTRERQEVIEEFLDYIANYQEVRVVTYKSIIEWMRNPTPLGGSSTPRYSISTSITPHQTVIEGQYECLNIPAWNPGTVDPTSGDQFTYCSPTKFFTAKNNPGIWESPSCAGSNWFWNDEGECGESTQTITSYHGTITPTGTQTVDEGSSVSFTLSPEAGYVVSTIKLDGALQPISNPFVLNNVQSNHTIEVNFDEGVTVPNYYDITILQNTGGSISPAGNQGVLELIEGSQQTFTWTLDPGYIVQDLIVDGLSQGPQSSYSFSNISSHHTIEVLYSLAPIQYTVISSAGANGSISPVGSTIVNEGSDQLYTIAPQNGYEIADITVDGISVGASSPYLLMNIQSNQTIEATFSQVVLPAPAAPTQLTAQAQSSDQILLNWIDQANNEDGYYIFWNTADIQPSTPQANLAANTESYSVTNLNAETNYFVWIQAYHSQASSSLVNTSATTDAASNNNCSALSTYSGDGSVNPSNGQIYHCTIDNKAFKAKNNVGSWEPNCQNSWFWEFQYDC